MTVGLVLLGPEQAVAQVQGRVELAVAAGLGGGFSALTDQDILDEVLLTAAQGEVTDVSEMKGSAGISVGVRLAEPLIVRIDWVRTRMHSATVDVPMAPATVMTEMSVSEYSGGVEYLIGGDEVVPFVAAGAGVARIGVDMSARGPFVSIARGIAETSGTYNVGGGARIKITERFSLRPAFQFVYVGGAVGEHFWRVSLSPFLRLN